MKAILSDKNKELSDHASRLRQQESRLKSQEMMILKNNRKMNMLEAQIKKPSKNAEDVFKMYRDQLLCRGEKKMRSGKAVNMFSMQSIRIEKNLGKGAFGEVYKAVVDEDRFGLTIKKEVALKQLAIEDDTMETMLQDFINEIDNLQSCGNHINVVQFYGVAWDTENFPFIVLEFCGEGDLAGFLKDYVGQSLEDRTLLDIAIDSAKGIQHIHSLGMIHRDIKPQNILLKKHDHSQVPIAKIADFGESRESDESLTMTYVGTPLYVAPEVMRGQRYGTAADIFSFGIVLNQIDTGERPYTGQNFSLMNKRNPGSARPARRADAPTWVRELIDCCLIFVNDEAAYYGKDDVDETVLDLTYGGRISINEVVERLSFAKEALAS